MTGCQGRQFEPASPGADRGGQTERYIAGFERRLALIQVAQRADLRQNERSAARSLDEGLAERAGGSAIRNQDNGVGQALGPKGREVAMQPCRQVVQEGPVGGYR